jgi:predicted amidohydrolase YtcJ
LSLAWRVDDPSPGIRNEWRDSQMRTITAGWALAVAVTLAAGTLYATEPAELVIVGGTVYTLDPTAPRVEAVAVSGRWIVATGSRDDIEKYRGPKTAVLDVTHMTVLPGLVDAHAHLAGLGNKLAQLDLVGTTSAEEVRRKVLERAKTAASNEWIEGRGWDQNDWEVKEFPTWRALDGTDSHPVCLRRVDGHAVWVNRRALETCGVTKDTPDPAGGRIIRDKNGEPTGVFVDNAGDLVTKAIPKLSHAERVRRLKLAVAECQRNGLTGVHDAGVGEEGLQSLDELDESGELGLRIYVMLDADDRAFAERRIRGGPIIDQPGLVTVRALKLYADGALGSRGAALIEPYSDDPENRGLFVHTREELMRWTRLALENGFQVCTHAIGDAANRMMLDIYEEALRDTKVRDPRLRIEHAQILTDSDIERFGRLGIIASMQPTHATSDMYWAADRLGTERLKGAYAWRRLLDTGCLIACGSDFPVEGVNPLWGIYAAVTRTNQQGWPEGGWGGDQCMTRDEAIRGFTANAAYASFMERVKGTIQPNMMADITILDKDIFVVPPEEILECRVVYTIVDGRVVYDGTRGAPKGE